MHKTPLSCCPIKGGRGEEKKIFVIKLVLKLVRISQLIHGKTQLIPGPQQQPGVSLSLKHKSLIKKTVHCIKSSKVKWYCSIYIQVSIKRNYAQITLSLIIGILQQ